MPALRSVPADHQPPFAPRGVYLYPHTSRDQVLLSSEAGRVGYTLKIPPRSSKLGNPNLPRLNWLVTSKLSRVDSRGRTQRLLAWRRARITGPASNGGFGLKLPGGVGYYRVEIVFRNAAGSQLGRFGDYLRVLRPVTNARLRLSAVSYRPGETISACLENLGTTVVSYGGCVGGHGSLYGEYTIQEFNGSVWKPSHIESPGFCAGVGLGLGPGRAADVGSFKIPADAPAGLYRALIEEANLSAEFQILPEAS